MEPELRPAVEEESQPAPTPNPAPHPSPQHDRDFDWVFIGPHGLRAGWSILLFAALYYLFREVIGTLFFATGLVHDTPADSAAAVLVADVVMTLVGPLLPSLQPARNKTIAAARTRP